MRGMQMTEPLSRNNRVAGAIKAAVTKGQEELGRAGSGGSLDESGLHQRQQGRC